MPPIFRFKFVDVDGKKLSIAVFRQLPIVSLCNLAGEQDETLEPFGVIRYKHEGIGLWAGAVQKDRLVRCPLSPEQKSRKYLEEKLDFWSEAATAPHNLASGEDSVATVQLHHYTNAIAAEPSRHQVHARVAALEQIFL